MHAYACLTRVHSQQHGTPNFVTCHLTPNCAANTSSKAVGSPSPSQPYLLVPRQHDALLMNPQAGCEVRCCNMAPIPTLALPF